jgi:hypothetical protein
MIGDLGCRTSLALGLIIATAYRHHEHQQHQDTGEPGSATAAMIGGES